MNRLLVIHNIEQAAVMDTNKLSLLEKMILPHRKSKLSSIESRKVYLERLMAYCAEGYLLSSVLKREPSDINIVFSAYGKPGLKDESFHYSISHAFPLAAVVVSDALIGVDVERVRPYNEEVCRILFSPGEILSVKGTQTDHERDCMYTRIWTRKEAYAKAIGYGFAAGSPVYESMGQDRKCFSRTYDLKECGMAIGCVTVCELDNSPSGNSRELEFEVMTPEMLLTRSLPSLQFQYVS